MVRFTGDVAAGAPLTMFTVADDTATDFLELEAGSSRRRASGRSELTGNEPGWAPRGGPNQPRLGKRAGDTPPLLPPVRRHARHLAARRDPQWDIRCRAGHQRSRDYDGKRRFHLVHDANYG